MTDKYGSETASFSPFFVDILFFISIFVIRISIQYMCGGKERIFDDMAGGFGWGRLPKSFMAENTVFLLLTAIIRNFYKTVMQRLDVKRFNLKITSRIKTFVFKFISVPAKWIWTARQFVLNIYTCNDAYEKPFKTRTLDDNIRFMGCNCVLPQVALWGKGMVGGMRRIFFKL